MTYTDFEQSAMYWRGIASVRKEALRAQQRGINRLRRSIDRLRRERDEQDRANGYLTREIVRLRQQQERQHESSAMLRNGQKLSEETARADAHLVPEHHTVD